MQLYREPVLNHRGEPVIGASVTVLDADGALASLFNADGDAIDNPVLTNENGEPQFRAVNGTYSITISGAGITARTVSGIELYDPDDDSTRVNVTSFMTAAQRADVAAGTTLTDTSAAIQACIDYVDSLPAQNRPQVALPAGRCMILEPIQMRDNVALVGVPRDTGYWYAFSHSSELIAGAAMTHMVDVTASNHCLRDIALYGNNVAEYGLYTAVPVGDPRKSGASWENVAITLPTKSAIHLDNLGLVKARNLQLSGFSECGIDLANTGDCDFDDLYINTGNTDSSSTVNGPSSATVYGVGIRLRDHSGNINIRGGKIEFNRVGVLMNSVDGVNVAGVQYDTNRGGDVVIIGDSMTAAPAVTTENANAVTSIQITGNRFLGGSENTQGTTGSIYVKNARYVTIAGNGIKRAGDAARDFATNTTQGHAYGIWLDNAELCTVVGNDLYGAGVTACLKINHATPANAQHTIGKNSLDSTELITAGTVRDEAIYSSQIFASGANPIAKSTAKAWVKFNGNGASPIILSSYNVASVTGAAGTYTVTFSTAMPNGNYVALVSVRNWFGFTDTGMPGVCSAGSLVVYSLTGAAPSSNGEISVAIFG